MRHCAKSPIDYELVTLLREYRQLCEAGLSPRLPVTRSTRFRRWIDRLVGQKRHEIPIDAIREDDELLDQIGSGR